MEQQTILVTGATDGLGREVARELARMGARVLVHGRDRGKAEAVRRAIAKETGSEQPDALLADLASLAQVRDLAREVEEATGALHGLVNNAGVAGPPRTETEDGHELHLAVNYLSHFLLTRELLPLAERLGDSEVTVNALHPATLMDTRMVRDYFGVPRTSVAEGARATLRLVTDPALDGVTGRYFDGLRESSAHEQAHHPAARQRLWELSERLTR